MKSQKKTFVFPGGGVFFFWMIGYMRELGQHNECTDIHMIGASAGALAMVCSLLELDPVDITNVAYRIVEKHNVHERWFGLIGVWKDILREWLDEILPPDSANKVCHRLHIRLLRFPYRPLIVSKFLDKKDLVECLLATCHMPFLMDYRPFYWYRGMPCYDGYVEHNDNLFNIFGDECNYHVLPYQMDDNTRTYLSIKYIEKKDAHALVQLGVDYARKNELSNHEKK